jgi:hypothetical protein
MHQSIRRVSKDSNICIVYLNNFSELDPPKVFISGKEQADVLRDPGNPNIFIYNLDLKKIRKMRLFGESTEISEIQS